MSLVVLMRHETVSAPQENGVSWILTGSGLAVTACPSTHAQEVQTIHRPERVLTGAGMSHKIEFLGTMHVR